MSDNMDLDTHPQWRTSSYCNGGNCVEVALLSSDTIGVRDNKNPESPVLTFTLTEWSRFVGGVRESR
ncbi:hypothetical protein Nocox_07725 [Nonomuraea coxensis DSM 45129]|uniref:DUF397 domain-containing protein n=1 Tax=Nonomuraea coxensis DSM 45129 TaxID=1122611 RepID=A0ABX8TUK2_9ACTN|nr:DUF397 domain-containing protein [Nonomuraea coxensis]QYC39170.1 hypothetical protein Nocox_07725 [Nonomuraea coxensis DSM 45129]